jgi:hypothetical protein
MRRHAGEEPSGRKETGKEGEGGRGKVGKGTEVRQLDVGSTRKFRSEENQALGYRAS